MVDQSTWADAFREGHASTYDAFSELRESFHRSGRLDDSNAKLDEVAKLFATYLAFKTGQIRRFPTAESCTLVSELQQAFSETVALPQYRLGDGNTIFGSQPALAIRQGDETMAVDMVRLVQRGIDLAFDVRRYGHPFDILNEAFGHFVRDNFRSNVEDAQFMTPPEVTNFMAELALQDILAEDSSANDPDKPLTVVDPSCGVGSFLGAVYQLARDKALVDPGRIRLFGQDKVERMVRLATLNLGLFDVDEHRITLGNSLERGSPLDIVNGKVDIILTNPPFGARFDHTYVHDVCGDNVPFFRSLRRTAGSIDSELLFVDRGLRLLRDGGRMLIIVPDSVISSKGIAALLRHNLTVRSTLRAVIELPSSTFAQAGTRTKTAILYLQKGRTDANSPVFMGIANHLGFEVSSRKGVQIKTPCGKNELPAIAATYAEHRGELPSEDTGILSSTPSCVMVKEPAVFRGNWTPKHYSATRIETVAEIGRNVEFEMVPLREMVEFCSRDRKPEHWRNGWAFISILHIFGEGLVNVSGVFDYSPKTPGIPTETGELLFARINPRIPRVCVTPDFGIKTLCSSEFEVMKVKDGVDAYMLAYMLQTHAVQNQIHSLTSGTSASHNRIRTSELSQVLIPLAKRETNKADLIDKLTNDYRVVLDSLAESATMLAQLRQREAEVFGDD